MDDLEIAACVAEVIGCPPEGASIEPLGGRQGLLVARVTLHGRRFIFKAVRQSSRRELALARYVAEIGGPAVLGGDDDEKRGLYWLVLEDLGESRLADSHEAAGYCAAAQALAQLQIRSIECHDRLESMGLKAVSPTDWENIALRAIERSDGVLKPNEVEQIAWSATELARDAATIPLALIHGDLHAGNIAIVSDGSARLLDWGSAYVAPAFSGLEELLWPATAWLKAESVHRVKAAYLREWASMLGKPGPLEPAVLASRTLLRMQILLSTLETGDRFTSRAVLQRVHESWEAWRRA